MNIDFQRVSFPADLMFLTREVIAGKPVTSIPKGWTGILIYHPSTRQYYSTKSVNPFKYEEIIRLREEPRWSSIAVALRKMLDHHPDFQFFILPILGRPKVENWMAAQGYRRVATMMGEGAAEPRVLFKVHSPTNKVSRYVVASPSAPKTKLIAQANTTLAAWLKSETRINYHERNTMRVATRSLFSVNSKVFENESEVTRTDLLNGLSDNEFRATCAEMNLRAVREFIRATVTG